jgi:hypothetical protein
MAFHAISISGNDETMIKIIIDRVLREKCLPAFENAQPLDF